VCGLKFVIYKDNHCQSVPRALINQPSRGKVSSLAGDLRTASHSQHEESQPNMKDLSNRFAAKCFNVVTQEICVVYCGDIILVRSLLWGYTVHRRAGSPFWQ
jgi:hypothetical protein